MLRLPRQKNLLRHDCVSRRVFVLEVYFWPNRLFLRGHSMPACTTTIIADSTCDIPAELIERYHIDVIPQIVIWGDQELRDRIDLQPEEFYQRLSTSPQLPTTSQPTIKSFGEHYQAAQAAGATAIVVLT